MREITKAQITIGLLAFFATVWEVLIDGVYPGIAYTVGMAVLQLVLLLILSYVIIAMLEWVKVFDLKTNAVLTLLVLVTLRLMTILNF
ncbi:MAG: hypothetical protein MUC80_06215 [Candidatus Thermoplasmatota archaeon]|jgi:hypothetical protein|nr:hypothetical protein [Candidatus Thermoplasmatota archaeon]